MGLLSPLERLLAIGLIGLMALFDCRAASAAVSENQLSWGVNAVVLKSPWSNAPSLDEFLVDEERTLGLNQFYRVGGTDRPTTPTQCHIAYNADALFVVVRCQEPDMAFPASDKFFPSTNRETNWLSLHGSPGGSDSWPPFPDEVDFLIQPDMAKATYYQFAATPDGSTFGCNRSLDPNPEACPDEIAHARHSPVRVSKVVGFEASVTRKPNEWLAFFQIPWATLGGKPNPHFGLLPLRTRWRDGEFSSPAALDFEECLPVDLFIETHFAGPEMPPAQAALCRLPSGIFRWQRPVVTPYPDAETRQQIWEMQASLCFATDTNNLAQRLYLTQRWMDLMTQEGFTPLPRAWAALTNNLTLAWFRQKMNAALQQSDLPRACHLLDDYLAQLDRMSRWWYADGSPGDILQPAWEPVTAAEGSEVKGNVLRLHCLAGNQKVELHLALPSTGGVRIFSGHEGFFKPAELLTLKANRSPGSWSIRTAEGKVVVGLNPFSIDFYNATGKAVTRIGPSALAFRFDAYGEVLAVDFKNHLDPAESIYGFGERYDNFNQNGHVLTLWGTDDWIGNGLGLRNTSYKLVPVFHSSAGYTAFDNSSYRLRADIGGTDPNQYRLTQHGPIFDYYFWIDSPAEALQSYTALTGRVPLPPKWVFEPWMGRGGGAWQSGPLHNAVAEEENTLKQFEALDIPHSAIYAEGPSANVPELNQFMATHGIKVLGYFYPDIRESRQESLMPELKPEQLPILRCADSTIVPGISYVDFSHPQAKELVRRALKPALDVGVAGSMVDFGDMVTDEARFYDGKRGDEMHNFYSYAYHRTLSELYREKRGDDFILYGRAAAPGTQKWVGQFAGDHPSNFDGLKAVLTGALNLCACGFSTWGSDLGGYFGLPEPAVYMRWIEFGCFSPIWRPHGKATRDPWYFGDAAVTSYKYHAWVRENILNYTYNAAVVAHETGIPIMRSLPIAFPQEAPLAAIRDEYMFGADLLVAPVLNEETSRNVRFPSGKWTSFWNGKTVAGPTELKVDAPLDTIPVYLRPGAVVPVQLSRELQFGRSMSSGRVDALMVTLPRGNENFSGRNANGQTGKVIVQSQPRGCSWKIEDFPEMSYLIVYGAESAAKISVDGKTVPQVTASASNAMLMGWQADPTANRLVICLSPDRPRPNKAPRTIEVTLNQAGK